ncbi:hypothetical protein PHMEG_00033239 [Phytophthora megakarya]|uniref:HTH CENPB-type domain-containing protein n=1 Tax=Phytophthora megakarya TaxID=4795 RepID=A0A225UU14_9STRA|nr:hypothetical protein PHMEG_00033239 [Phytophthora megakarya]
MAVSYHFKLQVLQYLDGHTMEETISHFYLGLLRGQIRSKKRVCYASKDSRALAEAKCAVGLSRHHRDRPRGLGTSLPIAAEEWVNDLRSDGVPVTYVMLKLQALELYAETALPTGAFTASWSWRKHFLRRHRLSIRRRTREGKKTPEDASERLEDFSTKVLSKMKELKI